jgi:tRNA 2-thiouridine synthesizing protein A
MGLFSKKSKAVENSAGHEATLEDGTVVTINSIIDCLGDSCPRPQLMTKAALSKAHSGETIEIQIDNSTSVEAIPPMMHDLGATHLATIRKDRHWQVLLKKN